MTIEHLNAGLQEFIEKYNDTPEDPTALADLRASALALVKNINQYYGDNTIARYNALNKTPPSMLDKPINTTYLYQQELFLQTRVKDFQAIYGVLQNSNKKDTDELAQIETRQTAITNRLLQIQTEKSVANNTWRTWINKNVVSRVDSTEQQLEKEISELEQEQAALTTKQGEIEARKTLPDLEPSEIAFKPMNYEEMHLVHSIRHIFPQALKSSVEAEKILQDELENAVTPEKLKEVMNKIIATNDEKLKKIQEGTEKEKELEIEKEIEEHQKTLSAMKELYTFYEDYIGIKDEPELLKLPDNYRIKAISYDLPQKFQKEDAAQTRVSFVGASVEIPRTQILSIPKKSIMRLEFENGAKLSVIPGPKPKLFLPSRASFTTDDEYKNSIKMFAEQYLKIHGNALVQNINLQFDGLDDEEQALVKKVFVTTLLEQQALIKTGENQVRINIQAFRNIIRVASPMYPKEDQFWQDFLKDYGVEGPGIKQYINLAIGNRTGGELSDRDKMISSTDGYDKDYVLSRKHAQLATSKNYTELLDKATELFQEQLKINPNPEVFQTQKDKWDATVNNRQTILKEKTSRRTGAPNSIQTLGAAAGDLLSNAGQYTLDAYKTRFSSDSYSKLSASEEVKKIAKAIGILSVYDKSDSQDYKDAETTLKDALSKKHNGEGVEKELENFIKARKQERTTAQSAVKLSPKKS